MIIALVLAVAVGSFLYLRNSGGEKLPADIAAVQKQVQDCFEITSAEDLEYTGLGGGYIFPPDNYSLYTEYIILSYWYYEGTDVKPSLKQIEEILNSDLEEFIRTCTDFSQFNFDVEEGNISVSTKIKQNSVDLILSWPLLIKKEDLTYKLEKPYKATYPVRLGMIYNLSSGVVELIKNEPEFRPISYIVSTFNYNGFNVTIIPYNSTIDNETIDADIYVIDELNKKNYLNGEQYTFVFAAKFNITNETEIELI